jgi:hypothetical protein
MASVKAKSQKHINIAPKNQKYFEDVKTKVKKLENDEPALLFHYFRFMHYKKLARVFRYNKKTFFKLNNSAIIH